MIAICTVCEGLIASPDEGVRVATFSSDSGPGWDVWAHVEHAHLARPDPVAERALERVAELRQDGPA